MLWSPLRCPSLVLTIVAPDENQLRGDRTSNLTLLSNRFGEEKVKESPIHRKVRKTEGKQQSDLFPDA